LPCDPDTTATPSHHPYNFRRVLVSDFHYDLPSERIAQEPLADRAASRLLHLDRRTGNISDRRFRDFPILLRRGDLLVINNTRVFPARLYGLRSGHSAQPVSRRNPAAHDFLRGRVEVLLTRQLSTDPNEWECLVHPGRRIAIGERLYFGDPPELEAEVIDRGSFGERRIRFASVSDFFTCVERLGHVPLPPYIDRADRPDDRDRYQTVYAQARGSVAAPTAGLHFTGEILQQIRARGIQIAEITLHVGLGTFQPVRVERVEDHHLHRESYQISPEAAQAINDAKTAGRRIVAVGTTTVRTLEYAASLWETSAVTQVSAQKTGANLGHQASGVRLDAGGGEADLFIYPGYQFRIVGALLTNFHLPQSTLLMLVCALGGRELVLQAYRHAVESDYRFYSYGDCMFVE
jgi:S-adenosylmethionine:tRNA ribosyltransferase-isomerase